MLDIEETVIGTETPAAPEEPVMTKGEALVTGLNQIDEGLKMISALGTKYDLLATMVGSRASAQRLRDVIKSNTVLYTLVINMVAAKNSRLSAETVQKVIDDLLDTLFDLSSPFRA